MKTAESLKKQGYTRREIREILRKQDEKRFFRLVNSGKRINRRADREFCNMMYKTI